MERPGDPRVTIRCAIVLDKTRTLESKTRSERFIKMHGGEAAEPLLQNARQNFEEVWKRTGAASRWSDGSYAVLYTAGSRPVALAERLFHARGAFFEEFGRRSIGNYIIYKCTVSGRGRDLTPEFPRNREMVHPHDYSQCHRLARDARQRGVQYLVVPSARKFGGHCVPIFDRDVVKVSSRVDSCRIHWEPEADRGLAEINKRMCPIVVDDVYGAIV